MQRFLLFTAATLTVLFATAGEVLRTAAALTAAAENWQKNDEPFLFTGVVQNVSHERNVLFVADATGVARVQTLDKEAPPDVQAGDLLEICGHTTRRTAVFYGAGHLERFRVLGKRPVPAPVDVSAKEFHSGRFDNRLVRVSGLVSDVVDDESDPNYFFIELQVDNDAIFIPQSIRNDNRERARALIGTCVRVVGNVCPRLPTRRTHAGSTLGIGGLADLKVVRTPPDDPFSAPRIETLERLRPQDIDRTHWYVAEGRVRATWGGVHLLLILPKSHQPILVDLAEGPLPPVGAFVTVCGFPEPNLFHVNLVRARWRDLEHEPERPQRPVSATIDQLLSVSGTRELIHPKLHGLVIRLRGRVRPGNSAQGFLLEADGRAIPVVLGTDCATIEPPAADSVVEVVGVCQVESEQWRPYRLFPKLTGVAVILRTAGDLRVLETPPWWTPHRLMLALAVIVLLLVGMIVWNRSLSRLSARRGHQLFREKVAHYEASLRVDERTKLAVELHDSLAQSLSGAFMELETAASLGDGANPDMLRHLQIAAATVKSCHGELRNCLWDLRNLSLDEPNLETAIRKTLAPHAHGIDVAVRFNVPRTRLSDNTAHAILRIIRELVLNAIRHGKATRIQIAGCIDGGKLLFSVRDNGCGFDPDDCPGILQGHFGLEGIRERAGLLAGNLELESAPGAGTKATVSIVLPTADTKEQA